MTMQARVVPATIEQPAMGTTLGDAAMVNDQDHIGVPHGGQAMRDDEHRTTVRDHAHIGLDDRLRFVIEGAGRFVQNKNARIRD